MCIVINSVGECEREGAAERGEEPASEGEGAAERGEEAADREGEAAEKGEEAVGGTSCKETKNWYVNHVWFHHHFLRTYD